MEELFRFSVLRAATRSNPATVSLERPPAPPPSPAPAPPAPAPQPFNRAALRPIVSSSLPAFIGARINTGVLAAATPPAPPKSFQDQLRDLVQSVASDN